MSGGGSLSAPEKPKRGKSSKRKPKKRVSFHLDMTPLVDITFLLLTFFMFTTTMSAPQTMEMSIPPEINTPVDVAQDKLLSIYIRNDDKLFWHKAQETPKPMKLQDVKKLSEKENLKDGMHNKLIIVLKIDKNAPYGTVVSVLDELNLAEILIMEEIAKVPDEDGEPTKRKRKFTIAKMTDKDREKISDEALSGELTTEEGK